MSSIAAISTIHRSGTQWAQLRARFTRFRRTLVAIPVLGALLFGAGAVTLSAPASAAGDADHSVVVHLTKYTTDLHGVNMALALAHTFSEAGKSVTLFLDVEGVRLADRRHPQNLHWGLPSPNVTDHYNGFIKSGGKVLLCPHCAKNAGITEQDLLPGAKIATMAEIVDMYMKAAHSIDY